MTENTLKSENAYFLYNCAYVLVITCEQSLDNGD